MTPQEALQVFGNQIQAQYFDGSDYTDCVFQYDSVQSVTSIESESSYQFGVGSQFLRYYCFLSPGTVQQNPSYITFDISPTYSIIDTNQIHTFIGLSSRLSISNAYQSPSWDWSVGGSTVHLENDDRISSGSTTRARLFADGVTNACFVPFDFSSVSTTSGYSFRATFSGNYGMGDNSNRYALCIGLPYISTDATGAAGTLPPESSGGDTNITVNVDMSETNEKIDETNGLLDSILSWIGNFFVNLGNTVRGWFVPSQDFISNWVHRLIEIIEDKFAPWPVADQTIKDIVQRLLTALGEGGVQSVDFPTITIPGVPDGPFIEGRSVPLKGDNGAWADLIEVFASFVDVVCTIWVLNMVCHRVKAVLVGEAVVEVEGSD